jgi:hypothetical protein
MAWQTTRALRGALAGSVAAGVWAAQQPLDKRVFGIDYDDAELLGRFVAAGPAGYAAGVGLHLANGALFGALYAQAAPAIPVPRPLRGPLAGLAEHLATWPATLALDRVPAKRPLPQLSGSWPAFAQATWRHLLFGTVLGELERRLNPSEPEAEPMDPATNGHGHADVFVSPLPTA